jgi:protocatechuate 4,5-dioxygenase, beta chain
MAEVVAAFGVPHTPLLWRLIGDDPPPDLRVVADEFARFRRLMLDARPDMVVIIGSDHFHQFDHTMMPAFLVGRADRMVGTFPNEERSFGLPRIEVPGHCGLAGAILGHHDLAPGFDFAFSNRPHLDHTYVVPLLYLLPDLGVPVVPIHTNTNAPPLPTARRFVDLGRYLRRVIDGYPADVRVVVVASGHLAFELGGPRQFSGTSPDPAFDRDAVDWIRNFDVETAAEAATFDRLMGAGNVSFQYLNLLALAALMGRRPVTAEGVACRFGNEPFFSWGPP